jgi:hypothetical protein
MPNKQSVIFVALEIILIVFGGISLWYKILLPTAYYLVAILLAALIIAQILAKRNSKSLVFQIALLVLFMNSVFYLATNYRIIPFWDGNWDFAVVKTFIQKEEISVLSGPEPSASLLPGYGPARILTTYSGWPLLHSLAFSLSQISGIDAFHISLALPPLISIISFLFVYLIVEKARRSLGLDTMVTNLALLIYATSAEALFYPIQFVQQNLGTMILYIVILTFCLSTTNSTHSREYRGLMVFFAMALVTAHHFTSFIMASFLFVYFALQTIQAHFSRIKISRRAFSEYRTPAIATLGIALLMSTLLFFWWNYYSTSIWRQIDSTLTRFLTVLLGARPFVYVPNPSYYPEVLRPFWATSLLTLRDVLIYVPCLFGLLLIMFRKTEARQKSFLMLSSLAFGLIIIIDNFTIRVETFRIFMLALPLMALLGATFFAHFGKNWAKGVWRLLFVATVLVILILAAFTGLWGHNFAPMHLYDPSISPSKIGERNIDFMRVNDFFSQKIQTTSFQAIWADDDAPLVSLLQPNDYNKIMRLGASYIEIHSYGKLSVNELVCAFSDLNLYHYYSGVSSTMTPEQGQALEYQLHEYVDSNLTRIYDDGKRMFWISEAP